MPPRIEEAWARAPEDSAMTQAQVQEASALNLAPVVEYPERDGKPMGETDVHRREIINAIETLTDFFRNDQQAYVAGDLLLYYEEGNPKAVVVPDVFVAFGVEKKERRTYKLWQEKRPPAFIIEVSSRSTRLEDRGSKRELYSMLGVVEYFLYDPLGEYLKPKLQGFRLQAGELRPIASIPEHVFNSETLGLQLKVDGNHLRFIDPSTETLLLTPAEALEKARSEEAARKALEQRNTELEAELARLRQEGA
jgi:Uma2 family endonuclease